MFDFIRRLFSGSKHDEKSNELASLELAEGNEIEVLKASEYSEGAKADAIEQLIADQEVPPPPDIELREHGEDREEEVIEKADESQEMEAEQPDNFLLGDLDAARKLREHQTTKAGISYWSEGKKKYLPRAQRAKVDGTAARNFNYFEVLRDDPTLRQVELQRPGMSIENLNLNRYIHNSLKGKLVSNYVLKSLTSIKDQAENGAEPLIDLTSTERNTVVREAQNRHLRDLFNAFDAQRKVMMTDTGAQGEVNMGVASFTQQAMVNDYGQDDIDELFEHFNSIFDRLKEDDIQESYTRWLLSVAEEPTASADILWMLADDPNPDVRFCLAENYNIDQTILQKLTDDENPYVAHRANKTLMRLSAQPAVVYDRDFGNADNRIRRSS